MPKPKSLPKKAGLHLRNRHRDQYDFEKLIQTCPELAPFVAPNAYGDLSMDFANPKAVKMLNRAILSHFYEVAHWDIPPDYLCPSIPGRADYIHHAADLLALGRGGKIPHGKQVRILDIGSGANCVYPLIGQSEYGWSFVAAEIDPIALDNVEKIIQSNPGLTGLITPRLQPSPTQFFTGIIREGEFFDFTLCNPPFHSSLEEAQDGSRRKWKNLGKDRKKNRTPVLNFSGKGGELWCEGGERAFILRMIEESVRFTSQCGWFSTLVSKETNLPAIRKVLDFVGVKQQKIIPLEQGQKKSRIVAWSFFSAATRTRCSK